MQNVKLLIEYDGTDYSGWQIQQNGRTVQGEIENGLERILGSKTALIGAGRTDKGVHALAQSANFKIENSMPADKIRSSLNGVLPRDIRILNAMYVDDNFDSRRDASARQYLYKMVKRETALNRLYALKVVKNLNYQEMDSAAELVRTKTDFNSFCKASSETENRKCKISKSEWHDNGDFLYYTIRADRFLHHMVRSLVGTMIEIGRGKLNIDDLEGIFAESDRRAAGPTAPAHGLYLERVFYPNINN